MFWRKLFAGTLIALMWVAFAVVMYAAKRYWLSS